MFDSEGNAYLARVPSKGENSHQRRVAMYSTNTDTLERAKAYMAEIEIAAIIRATNNSASHYGTKIVYELRVQQNKQIFERFATQIGSSIARKQATLDAIVKSYVDNIAEHKRQGQLKGAAAKHQKLMTQTLPQVVIGVRQLIEKGVKPTQTNCYVIPSYGSIQRYIRQADLVRMALELDVPNKGEVDD